MKTNDFEILESLTENRVLIVSVHHNEMKSHEGNLGTHNSYLYPWDEKAKGKQLVTVEFVEGCDECFNRELNKSEVKKLAEELMQLHDLMEEEKEPTRPNPIRDHIQKHGDFYERD